MAQRAPGARTDDILVDPGLAARGKNLEWIVRRLDHLGVGASGAPSLAKVPGQCAVFSLAR